VVVRSEVDLQLFAWVLCLFDWLLTAVRGQSPIYYPSLPATRIRKDEQRDSVEKEAKNIDNQLSAALKCIVY
jgi:hypothetical protein